MKVLSPIAAALFPLARSSVLGLLYSNPDRQYYVNEVVRAARVGKGAVQRELARLTAAELLTRSTRGNLVLYQANRASPVFPDLLGLVNKTVGIVGILRVVLRPLRKQISAAFVYGSIARGTERSSSDIDVMIIGDVSLGQVVPAIHDAEERLAREINPNVFPASEFRVKVRGGDPFLRRVLTQPRLPIIGEVNDAGDVAA